MMLGGSLAGSRESETQTTITVRGSTAGADHTFQLNVTSGTEVSRYGC